ncbi:hypothetical protein [Streptomyces sp. NPDC018347]|uniref:hypothetical protein n=1 Tax=Streptomyces sp. NPDC018347 TaxID=3157193 RepID=UPI00341029E0
MKITNHVPVTADARAQVVGTGRPGLATARQALAAGAEISLSGPSPHRPAAVRDDRPGPARRVNPPAMDAVAVNPPVVDAVAVNPRAVDASAAAVGAAAPRSALGRPLPGAVTGRSRDGGSVTRPSVSGGTGGIGGISGSVTRPSVSNGIGSTGSIGGTGGTGGIGSTGGIGGEFPGGSV